MKALAKKFAALLVDEDGMTTVEYALLVFLLILVVLTGVTWWGQASAVHYAPPVR